MKGSAKRKTREDGRKNILCSKIIVDSTGWLLSFRGVSSCVLQMPAEVPLFAPCP
jgi:hypothetical protein